MSERFRRNMPLPRKLSVPDEAIWRPGYAAVAAEIPELEEKTLDAALHTVGPFLNPVLTNQDPTGTWNPLTQRWD